ncbi:Tyrocidine synthase 3 [Marinomonas spartinae]|uniref:Tyrocidine synthase 3 n=1 Tax=Marinomonas spartinae TaxID=1792290 RepID=A0A1A8TMC7_9GAMM|nr:amino acid adenylation domain-containing protein [Marinomonas spartinae]SBS34864.1 Tyrocidine synthase 3 [Marinomonas spartinae]
MFKKDQVFNDISKQSVLNPTKEAVLFQGENLSFSELEYYSNRLANYLIINIKTAKKLDFNKGSDAKNIAVFLEPSLFLPVVILAIMKAGLSYVPLSSFLPVRRIQQILDDSQACLTITSRRLFEQYNVLAETTSVLIMDDIDLSNGLSDRPVIDSEENPIAYTLYTSGSTGRPKGVEVEHSSLSYYLHWFNTHLWTKTEAILPLTSSLSFAASLTQLFTPLLRGDTLHILPAGILNQPEALLEWYQDKPNAALYCVPTIWSELLDYKQSLDRDVVLPKTLFLSGEAVPEVLKERTFAEVDNVRLFNLYGPTETVANCSFSELEQGTPVTLGHAIEGSHIFLLDKQGLLVGDGEVGEICVSGPGVAYGYSNQPLLTAKHFFLHQQQKAYRTGDLGQFNHHGELLYLGRQDNQVKVNGVRIELADIEENLRQHPNVSNAVVLFTDMGLIAYLLCREHVKVNELRSFMLERCPGAMIPSQFICLDAFPKLPNGKLDRNRLPSPAPVRPDLDTIFQPAANDLEQELIDIWQEVLGFCNLGAEDDFFDLGGNSLHAMRARTLIRQRLYSNIDFSLFFHNTTPRKLAMVVPYYIDDEDMASQMFTESLTIPAEDFSELSSQQSYFLALEQTSSQPKAYHPAFLIRAQGKADIQGIEWSVKRVLESNPVLRSQFDLDHFTVKEGGIATEAIHIAKRDFQSMGMSSDHLSHQDLLALADLPDIDLENTPAISLAILMFPKNVYMLICRVHHSVFDHDSIGLFFDQFTQAYRAFIAGDYSFASEVYHQYAPYVKWQKTQPCHSDKLVDQEEWRFWLTTLEGYLGRGADASAFEMKAAPSGQGLSITLTDSFSQAIRHFAHQKNTTAYVLLLTLFNLALNRETPYKKTTIGLPVSNRALLQGNNQIGCFVNMMTYFESVEDTSNVVMQLEASSKKLYNMLENQMVPYQMLSTELRKKGWADRLHSPVIFNFLNDVISTVKIDQCEFNVTHIVEQFGRCDLILTVDDCPEFVLNFDYENSTFTKEQMSRFAQCYLQLISSLLGM